MGRARAGGDPPDLAGAAPRLLLALSDGEIVEVRAPQPSATVTAHRTIVAIARDFH